MQSLMIDSLTMVIYLSGIPMVAIALATGCAAMLQAATQIQEQSVIHLVRLVTFIAIILVAGDWAGVAVCELFERSLRSIETIGRRGP
ncbi:MAG: Bacterial export protein family 3 [Pseudomonadota bacterium]